MPLLSNKTLPKNAIGTLDELMSSMIIQREIHYITPNQYRLTGHISRCSLREELLLSALIGKEKRAISLIWTCLDHRTGLGAFFWNADDADNYIIELKERWQKNAAYQN
jgi:hypothetical protein